MQGTKRGKARALRVCRWRGYPIHTQPDVNYTNHQIQPLVSTPPTHQAVDNATSPCLPRPCAAPFLDPFNQPQNCFQDWHILSQMVENTRLSHPKTVFH